MQFTMRITVDGNLFETAPNHRTRAWLNLANVIHVAGPHVAQDTRAIQATAWQATRLN